MQHVFSVNGIKHASRYSLGAAMAILLCASCANSPAIAAMDAMTIQSVPDDKLCYAYAHDFHRPPPVLSGEVKRRALNCQKQVAEIVSDCSMLSMTRPEPAPSAPGSTIYTVANSSGTSRVFKVCAGMFQSSTFYVGANKSGRYGVMVDPNVAKLGSLLPNTTCPRPILNDCRVPQPWEEAKFRGQ